MFNGLSPALKGLLLGLTGYSLFTIVDMLVKFVAPHYGIAQIIIQINAGVVMAV